MGQASGDRRHLPEGDLSEHFDEVRSLFERQVAKGRFPGGQLVVRHRGEVVLDVAAGVARGFRPSEQEAPVPVTPATRFALFSASKPVVAVAIAMLEEENSIDVNAPVAKYWPAFGKPELTVLDVLTHRASVMTPELIANPRAWGDEEQVRAALIEAKPKWRRGTLAYMPYEFGWILAEVVRGATGQSLQSFIEARLPQVRFGAKREELPSLARTYWQGGKVIVAGNDLSQTFEEANNLPEVLTAFVPAAGLVCTAAALAEFYDALIHGKLIKPETLKRYTTGFGYELDKSNRIPLRMARGFLLGSRTPSIYGWWGTQHVFGHAGAFCTLGWGEVETELAVAIVTNGNRGPYESLLRFAPLGSAIRRAAQQRHHQL